MFPRRDGIGRTTDFKQSRYEEPHRSTESPFVVPRSEDRRLQRETINVTNPSQGINQTPRNNAPANRKLPPRPQSAREMHIQDNYRETERVVPKEGATESSEMRSNYADPSHRGEQSATRAVRPLVQNDKARKDFRVSNEQLSGQKWRRSHGTGEKDPVGQAPSLFIGHVEEQLKCFKDSKELLSSLRVGDEGTSPEKAWWRKSLSKSPNASVSEDMPPVFDRLTDHKLYTGMHKNRFDDFGVGMGLEGTRDDTEESVLNAGLAQITREQDVEMDSPNKPIMSWEVERRSRSSSRRSSRPQSQAGPRKTKSKSTSSVFDRLYEPARVHRQPDGEHETRRKTLNQFGSTRDMIPSWQSGVRR